MNKVYIKDQQDNKVLPYTHVSAVLDDEGNDLSSHLGAFEDEVRGLVETPHQEYVTVATYSALPASGSEDTIYRVSSWDGSANSGAGAVDVTVYSEYAWNGSDYVFLCVKSQIDEVFDITVYNSNTKYADLSAALGVNGVNIPESLRKGGMSVKYVQSSDNNYAQFRYMPDDAATVATFTNPVNWSFCGDGVIEENPLYLYAETDSNGRLSRAIEVDGTNYFPKIDSPHIVDSKNNKTVIDADFASSISHEECSEFLEVENDTEGRLAIGVKRNGEVYIPNLKSPMVVKETYTVLYNDITTIKGFIRSSDNLFVNFYSTKLIPVNGGESVYVKGQNENCSIAFLKNNNLTFNTTPNFSEQERYNKSIRIGANKFQAIVPSDVKYIAWAASGYITELGGAGDQIPEYFIIDDTNLMSGYKNVASDVTKLMKTYLQANENYVTPYISEEDLFNNKVAVESSKNTLQFLMHTDNHINAGNKQKMLDHASVYSEVVDHLGLDFQLNTGDVFDNLPTSSEAISIFRDFISTAQNCHTPFMYVQGNHETIRIQGYESLTKEQIFGVACRKYNRYMNIARAENDPDSCLYYYFDIDFCKIRCFCLDSGTEPYGGNGYSDMEVQWLKDNIESLPSDYGVIIACHIPFYTPAKWKDHAYTTNQDAIRNYLIGKVEDSLNLIAVVHGHLHWDNVVYDHDLKCPFIATCSDKWESEHTSYPTEGSGPNVRYDNSDPYSPLRESNSINEYLADVYNVNKDSELIHIIRFGAGRERFVHRDFIELTSSLTLPQTRVRNPTWSVNNSGIATIENGQIVKVSTGYTTLYAMNENVAEFWYIEC